MIKKPNNQKLKREKRIKDIGRLYGIFTDFKNPAPFVVLTEKGAEDLLDKINEIIDKINLIKN